MDLRWRALLALTALKLVLLPSYRSTDFEVHRNWLAITNSLPLSQWYKEATSEWTLDYPPLFAWFEWGLSHAAYLFDPAMLDVSNLNHASPKTVLFQRISVIFTDTVLYGAAWFGTRKYKEPQRTVAFLLLVANAGLLLVDHIHFQYNGFLLGILLWSMALIQEGHDLLGGLLFAVLLNMKHLFACLGPLYFVYLLRHYCRGKQAVSRFLMLGAVVTAVFAISFGPFILAGQLQQVLGRLFPFDRGLMHAYWAANLWALYAAADRALAVLLPRFGFPVEKTASLMTGGLVQVSSFAVLPNVTAGTTLIVVLFTMAPMLVCVWRNPKPEAFAGAAAYACMCSFMAGYHVHEKAILMVILPLTLGAVNSRAAARSFLMLSMTGHYALLPLLFTKNEYPMKVIVKASNHRIAICLL
ncbi:ALG6, ALG8 glycosyltransferase [Coccomyxa subellipsoidea C-169]|uniref:Alpha-1,3-glucosyltransferase n=1 Tax=Coccomyxa subellipsoidea (strain C-169) TaxID=574566 RepID=I0YHZ8_COCSC|nr:ALG6, ALG8 glycosyltransferase [Coccomyxa subellipsoidea C-169]EIE18017.1 ALG6, ALG8 glycosyltransferase [Coccomyxa subellipsoidea C-169]|eukprot:XP_005642561.1 ALG6, ALG8 glycosyltransferase [Coccomyxa subellipsoidea C-169]